MTDKPRSSGERYHGIERMNRDQFLTLSLTDLTFKELLALFRRRWGVVLCMVLIALAVGLGISAMVPSTWRATSVVLVEGKTQSNNKDGKTRRPAFAGR